MQLFLYKFLDALRNEKMTKLKIFYLKLDLIGEKYVREYEDNSSQQFETLSTKIMEEVNN